MTQPSAPQPRTIPATAGATTPENPWPLRLLSAKLTEYIAKSPAAWLEGQVVQITRRPGQNTAYLTLRDTDVNMSFSLSVANRVLNALPMPLSEGSRVVVHAKAQFFAGRGSLVLSADDLRPVGVGELLARIEQLRRVLAGEGLFDSDRKRPLPFLPGVIGLICGRASAAERDVIENARRRWPQARFEVRNVAVQGPNAVSEVSAAIAELDAVRAVDVIVVTRGGGSLEDLLPFSNETVLRAAAACRTPLVSAIGHEVDAPLLDLVADVRASTPTDAARRIVPDVAAERAAIAQSRDRVREVLIRRIAREAEALATLRERDVLAAPESIISMRRWEIDDARDRTARALSHRLQRAQDDVAHLGRQVRALSPAATLGRGYAVVQLASGDAPGAVVRDPAQVPGRRLRIRVANGEFAAVADSNE